ncbi:CapA family protein [Butyrivibrio sp. LC3010]|uniref:CapA family protein n=1 Tax=Butyrivibrio sp. LC3010 TaxID=1280680 RepID=UPI0004298171|nr:CapA family protein [Butyrivibrio sp. LC3010]
MRITFLGDVMMQPEQLPLYSDGNRYDFAECFEFLSKYLQESDYTIANLETPIADNTEGGYTNKLYEFNTPVEFARALKDAGVNMVTTANNHCLDRGLEGLFLTNDNLDMIGIDHIGTRNCQGDSFVIKKIGNVNVGFLAFTYGTNAFANNNYLTEEEYKYVDMLQNQELSNSFDRNLLYNRKIPYKLLRVLYRAFGKGQFDVAPYERREKNKKRLTYYFEQIKKCRNQGADIVISMLHIGGQYNEQPSEYTKEMCSLSIENGASFVVANHEHVIHGWDYYNGHFCEHSLGNLVSVNGVTVEPFDKMAQYSMALNADIEREIISYSFSLFHSVLKDNGKIVCIPVFDEWNSIEANKKDKLEKDVSVILNRLYHTQDKKYQIKSEYSIS